MLYGVVNQTTEVFPPGVVLILIFLENALRPLVTLPLVRLLHVLILIFLENALRLKENDDVEDNYCRLNPYFFGKCSTAL